MSQAAATVSPSSPPVSSSSPRTSFFTKLSYGFGAVAFGVKDNGFRYFLLPYYNLVLGMPADLVGKAILIALVIDAFVDPLVGYLSDNFRSKWGRRHPFMYASIIPVFASFYMLWNPPALSQNALFYYLIVMAILVRSFITIYEIPSAALAAELTDHYDERTSMLTHRYFFGWWGGLAMALLTYQVLMRPTEQYPNGQLNPAVWQKYGWIAALIMSVSVVISCLGTQRFIPNLKQPPAKRPFGAGRVIRELRESLTNRSFLVLFISAIFTAAAAGLATSLNLYFTTYFWELRPDQIGIITLGPVFSTMIAAALTTAVSRRLGKKGAAISISLAAIAVAPLLVGSRVLGLLPENGSPLLVPLLFAHSTLEVTLVICASIVIASMVTDTVEESELTTGRRSEGLYFSARAFLDKSVNGLGVYGATVLLVAVNFPTDAKPGQVDPTVIRNLALVYMPASLLLNLLSIFFIGFYGISRETHEANLRRLAGEGEQPAEALQPAVRIGVAGS